MISFRKIKLLSIDTAWSGNVKITAETSEWFGLIKKTRIWIGSCTVFHDIDTGEMESHVNGYGYDLSKFYQLWKMGKYNTSTLLME